MRGRIVSSGIRERMWGMGSGVNSGLRIFMGVV